MKGVEGGVSYKKRGRMKKKRTEVRGKVKT